MASDLFNNLVFSLSVTLPILFVLALGIWLKRKNIIDDHFTEIGSRLVFNVALPSMLFLKIADAPIVEQFDITYLGFAGFSITACVIAIFLTSKLFSNDNAKISVFIQGAYRGNMGIVGLALVINAYGHSDSALAQAAVYLGSMTLLYNLLAVVLLQSAQRLLSLKTLIQLLSNPLIIAILLAVFWSLLEIPMYGPIKQTGSYFADLSLPLALICIGGSLKLTSLNKNKSWVFWASALKLAIIPSIITVAAVLFGFRGEQLGILFLFMASPTAAASYVMAKQFTKHGELAAEIIVISTLFGSISITIGLFLLKSMQLI